MLKILKNKAGFGIIGMILTLTVLMIMTAMIIPTFTARMNYKQAQYTVGVIKTIENAENAYMAKNNSFADLTTLASQGYLSDNFLQSVQGAMYPQPNWINLKIANQGGSACIDNGSGCPNNPGVGNNGYFMGIYNIPPQYQTYIEHELPGSGASGTQDVSYVAPVPSAPPVATANYANSAGSANYANTAGYANSSGLPAWSQEQNSFVGSYYSGGGGGGSFRAYNITGNTLLIQYNANCVNGVVSEGLAIVPPGAELPRNYGLNNYRTQCELTFNEGGIVVSAYSG